MLQENKGRANSRNKKIFREKEGPRDAQRGLAKISIIIEILIDTEITKQTGKGRETRQREDCFRRQRKRDDEELTGAAQVKDQRHVRWPQELKNKHNNGSQTKELERLFEE